MVPHLVTALTGPINELEQRVLDSTPAIERWFRLEWMEHTPPIYSAVDVRNAGFKLAPTNTDLFPNSWHHLTADMLPLAVQAAMAAIEKICPEARNLLLIPGEHNDNPYYLSNLAQLKRIFHAAGLDVRIGSISPEITEAREFHLPNSEPLLIEPVSAFKGRIGLKNFDPCTVLLNNDLSSGVPGILEELPTQYVLPPLQAGWSTRRKSLHLQCYEDVCKRMGKLLGIDPWLINPMYAKVGEVNFREGKDTELLASHVDALLTKIRRKYKEYGINEKPFVAIKSDMGATGMGTVTVRDAKEIDNLPQRRAKDKAVGDRTAPGFVDKRKESRDLIVQEGVLTNERMNDLVAEPVVYMVDRYVVGGFYRVHAERRSDESLSGPRSRYIPLAFARSSHLPQMNARPGASAPNRFYMYGVVARLAMLAASYELEATDPERETYD
ncbi:MAG: hypothetical protein RLZZ401_2022 [Pseudomonadota bacterium]|jgi:glutamate--cysteine ligase